jgi:hypothetical protein
MAPNMSSPPDIEAFTTRLGAAGIVHHRFGSVRDGTTLVEIAVPGERWEVEFLADGTVEVDRFRSDGSTAGAEAFDEFFEKLSD